jgi:hypothetical protein
MKLRFTAWDIVTGIPAGLLILMGTMLFSTLLGLLTGPLPAIVGLLILAFSALLTGMIAGLTRGMQGIETALAAGVVAALLLLLLRLNVHPGEAYNPLVFGPTGMLVAPLFSTSGSILIFRHRTLQKP